MSAEVADVAFVSSEAPSGLVGAKVPFITRQPVAASGPTTTLTVAAVGTGPLEYQWLRNGEEVIGATEATLTFAVSRETAGSYRALVRNRAGTTLRAMAEARP